MHYSIISPNLIGNLFEFQINKRRVNTYSNSKGKKKTLKLKFNTYVLTFMTLLNGITMTHIIWQIERTRCRGEKEEECINNSSAVPILYM